VPHPVTTGSTGAGGWPATHLSESGSARRLSNRRLGATNGPCRARSPKTVARGRLLIVGGSQIHILPTIGRSHAASVGRFNIQLLTRAGAPFYRDS
jgi:hypothetical protein